MKDKERFSRMARYLRDQARVLGLKQSTYASEESHGGGWWTRIARWPADKNDDGRKPVWFSLFFDKELMKTERRFWIGLDGHDRRTVASLATEATDAFGNHALYDFEKDTDEEEHRNAVVQARGLALEHYDTDEHYFGIYDFGASPDADESVAMRGSDFIGRMLSTLAEWSDIDAIKNRGDRNETERKSLIAARRGQGSFRDGLIRRWKGCAVTGCTTLPVLRASHIKPWCDSTDHERLDPANGLLLTAHLDALFDAGLITFTDGGDMTVSRLIGSGDRDRLGLVSGLKLRHKLSKAETRYLQCHRRARFQG